MRHRHERYIKHIDFILLDIVVYHISFVLAYMIRFGTKRSPYLVVGWRNIAVVMTVLDLVILFYGEPLKGILQRGIMRELSSLLKQTSLLVLLTTFYLYIIHGGQTTYRTVLLLSGVIFVIINSIVRAGWKWLLRRYLKQQIRRFAIVGDGPLVDRLKSALTADVFSRYTLDAVLTGTVESLPRLEQLLEKNMIDDVVIVQDAPEVFNGVVSLCEKYGCRVRAIPFYVDALSANTEIEQMGDIKLLNFRACPLDSMCNALVKRTFDIVASIILIVLTSPIMLVAAIGTRLSSPGPILFRQQRVGQYRKIFTMLKFRSMRVTDVENTAWTTDNDPRRTKFGSLLRKTSLDELPQLFNVLKGDMSLVGPRPEILYHVDHFKDEIPLYLVRQQVRPGITGWAQINGLRGDTDIGKRVRYDIWYIENWTLALDIKIVLKTPARMGNSEIL